MWLLLILILLILYYNKYLNNLEYYSENKYIKKDVNENSYNIDEYIYDIDIENKLKIIPKSIENNIILDINNSIKRNKNNTIKSIYDELTNDNRLEKMDNLDNLEANNIKETYLINNRYGTTNFDTYSL
jgi:hypothetical protein